MTPAPRSTIQTEARRDGIQRDQQQVACGDLNLCPWRRWRKNCRRRPKVLTQAEAQQRLTQYGPNEIEEKKTNETLGNSSAIFGAPSRG